MTATAAITCRGCRRSFIPDEGSLVAGVRWTCLDCRAGRWEERRCEGCGRVLRAGNRRLCLSCLTGGSGL
jgi:hypothetical protein